MPLRHPQLNENGQLRHLLTIEGLPRELIHHILDTAATFVGVSDRDIKKVPTLRGKWMAQVSFALKDEASTLQWQVFLAQMQGRIGTTLPRLSRCMISPSKR